MRTKTGTRPFLSGLVTPCWWKNWMVFDEPPPTRRRAAWWWLTKADRLMRRWTDTAAWGCRTMRGGTCIPADRNRSGLRC